jgi:hypothetical protein
MASPLLHRCRFLPRGFVVAARPQPARSASVLAPGSRMARSIRGTSRILGAERARSEAELAVAAVARIALLCPRVPGVAVLPATAARNAGAARRTARGHPPPPTERRRRAARRWRRASKPLGGAASRRAKRAARRGAARSPRRRSRRSNCCSSRLAPFKSTPQPGDPRYHPTALRRRPRTVAGVEGPGACASRRVALTRRWGGPGRAARPPSPASPRARRAPPRGRASCARRSAGRRRRGRRRFGSRACPPPGW